MAFETVECLTLSGHRAFSTGPSRRMGKQVAVDDAAGGVGEDGGEQGEYRPTDVEQPQQPSSFGSRWPRIV